MAGKDNLKPCKDTETAKARGKQGGIKSGISKRKHKLMSQIYADILADQNGLPKGKKYKDVVNEIVGRKDSASVSMLKEIREATEGNKMDIEDSTFTIIIKNATRN